MPLLVGNFGNNFLPASVIAALGNDNIPVYGVQFDGTNSAGTRTYDAANMTWQRSSNSVQGNDDFANVAPFNVRECITQYNSTSGEREVLAYKGGSNWSSLVAAGTGDRMIEIPCFWYSRPSKYEFLIAPQAKVGFKPSPMHYRNGVLHDKVRVTKYNLNNNYASQPGSTPRVSTDMNTFRTSLRAKGMYLLDYPTWCSLVMLCMVKYANMDVQTVVGMGSNTGNALQTMGGADSVLGLDGSATSVSANEPVLTLGIENLFSNCWKYIDGLYGYNGYLYTKDIESITSDPVSANDLMVTYTQIGTQPIANAGSSQAATIKDIAFDSQYDWMQFPTAIGTPSPTGDGVWANTNFNCVIVGGSAWNGAFDGLFSFDVSNSVGYLYNDYGAVGVEF